jgi:PAS domain S-box-containing protein
MTAETDFARMSRESPDLWNLIDTIPVLVLCALRDGFAEFANRAWREYAGRSLEQLTGWGWRTILHPDEVTQLIDRWSASLTSANPFETEVRMQRADGKYKWFSIRSAPAVSRTQSSESSLRTLIVFEDINERKEAQAKLQQSEAQQQAFSDNSPNLICLKDRQGRYFYANKEFQRALRVTEEQIKGKRDEELFSVEQAAAFQANDLQVLETGARVKYEDISYREDGQHTLIVQKFPLFDADGKIYALGSVATDITERQREESARRYSDERHRLVVETAPDAVVSMDDNGIIQFANPATARVFGHDPTELVGRPLTVLMPEFMRSLHETGFRRYLATGHRHINWQGTELTALRKNGEEFPVEISFGEQTRDEHKVFTGFIRDISKRRQAEDKLRASERSLRELTETIPQMLWSAEEDGTVNYCNQRTLDYTGLSAEEVRSSGWLTAVHPDDVETTTRAWLGSVTSGEAFQCEFRFRRASDTYRWCISNAVPLRDLDGKVIKWFGTVIDLHDWREAQQALHAIQTRQVAVRADVSLAFGQKEGLEAILHECAESLVRHLDAAFARIWTLSRDGTMLELRASAGLYTHLNGAHSRIPIGQLKIGTIARERTHVLTNDIINDPRISDKTWAANEGMTSFAGYPLLVGTRTLGVMAMFSRRPLATGTAETLESVADLIANGIERKHAEDKLRASERDLSLIIETIPGLVWCAAPDGELTYLNRRILEYTGTSSSSFASLGWTSFLHTDDVDSTVRAWSNAVATGQAFEIHSRLRRHDGAFRWFHVLGQAAHDNEGRVTRWYGLLIDISDRKNIEEALRGSEMRLSRATRTATIGEFAAAIAHEINQPLAAVVTNGEACLRWLSAEPPGLARAQEAAARIVRDGKEAGEIVRRIRALFKKASFETIELDLNGVIAEVLHLLSSETAKRRVAVEADLADDLPPVVGDRVQLQQLIFNLLLNGVEAMDPVVDRPRKLFIGSKQHNPETVLVVIRDSGVGMEDSEKVFEAFFTTKENGLGMGLAVCRSIIDAHHGRLWASSDRGAGTTFSFTLPVQPRGIS